MISSMQRDMFLPIHKRTQRNGRCISRVKAAAEPTATTSAPEDDEGTLVRRPNGSAKRALGPSRRFIQVNHELSRSKPFALAAPPTRSLTRVFRGVPATSSANQKAGFAEERCLR